MTRGLFERGDAAVNDHRAINERLRSLGVQDPFRKHEPYIVPTPRSLCDGCITPYLCRQTCRKEGWE